MLSLEQEERLNNAVIVSGSVVIALSGLVVAACTIIGALRGNWSPVVAVGNCAVITASRLALWRAIIR